jgi:hypothetical protein
MQTDEGRRKEHTHQGEEEADVKRERDNMQDALREDNFATPASSGATGTSTQRFFGR